MRNLRLATLISRTSIFPAIWTRFFVMAHTEKYIKAFQGIGTVFPEVNKDNA